MPPGDSKTIQVTENQNINIGLSVGNALLVTLTGSTFTGNVDFKSTIDGENYSNHPYIQYHSAAPARSVDQIANPSTATSYVILPPATQLQIAVSGVSAGSLTVRYAEINFNFADPTLGGSVAASEITGILAIANGGTAASTEAAARTNLGLEIGTDVQAYSANLAAFAAKSAPTGDVVGTSDSQTLSNKSFSTNVVVSSADVIVSEGNYYRLDGNASGDTYIHSASNVVYVTAGGGVGLNVQSWGMETGNLHGSGYAEFLRATAAPRRLLIASADNAFVPTLSVDANGLLEITAHGTQPIRLAWTKGTGGVVFGDGAGTEVAHVDSAGNIDGTSLTLDTALAVAEGGTGATSESTARSNLGLEIGVDVQAYDADLASLAGLTAAAGDVIYGSGVGTWAKLAAGSNGDVLTLAAGVPSWAAAGAPGAHASSHENGGGDEISVSGLSGVLADDQHVIDSEVDARITAAIGSTVQAYDADLAAIAALSSADGNFIVGSATGWVAESGATARTSLGLGSLATQSSVNDGDWSGTDLAVGNGGTGASTAADARTNLGVAIGSDVQAYDADLAAIAALLSADGNMIVGSAGGWVAESGATLRTSIGVAIGSDVQAYDAGLAAIAGLLSADGNFIVGNGITWVAESGATVRTSLGLGSLATQSTINNGDWSGTDLSVPNGGTGASSFTDHGVMLGSGTGALSVTAVGSAGQVLTSNGALADPTFQDASGGIEEADQWRLHTSFTGDKTPINANLERVDTDGFGKLGTGMSESSGIFTFPSTGVWLITFTYFLLTGSSADAETNGYIQTTENNSTYDTAAWCTAQGYTTGARQSAYAEFVFDVTSTTTHKVRFSVGNMVAGNTVYGSTGSSVTYMTFVRLGDT